MSARAVRTVMAKETVDGLRDRRSLMSSLIFPMVGPLMLAMMFGRVTERQSAEEPLHLPVVGAEHAPGLIAHLEQQGVIVEKPPADPEAAVRSGDVPVILVVPEEHGDRLREAQPSRLELLVDASRNESRTPLRRTRRHLEAYGSQVAAMRLLARGVHPEVVRPVAVEEVDLATPQQHAANLLNMVPVFVMLAAFIGGMFVATDSTAGERERKSLEPLLLNPVSRLSLVLGKWLATTLFAVTTLVLTIAGSVWAIESVPLHEIGLSLRLDATVVLLLAAAQLPVAPLAAALQLLVASFARSFREAQTYLSILVFVPMIPGVYLSLETIETTPTMLGIPIFGAQLLVMDILRGQPPPATAFLLTTTLTLTLTALCLLATTRLFSREKMIT